MISFIFLEIKDFMNNLCAIVSGGQFSELNGIESADFIIACDKGYEYLLGSDLSPDLSQYLFRSVPQWIHCVALFLFCI